MTYTFPHRELTDQNVAKYIRRKHDLDVKTLIRGYLPLALNILLSRNNGEVSQDGVKRAIHGLIHAIDSVPSEIDHKFGTYVAWHVRQTLNSNEFTESAAETTAHWSFALAETKSLMATGNFDHDW